MDHRFLTAWLSAPLFIQITAFSLGQLFHLAKKPNVFREGVHSESTFRMAPLKDVVGFKAGKVKFQVTTLDPSTRVSSVHYETYEEMKARHAAEERAAAEFKSLRKELGLSQCSLAQALRVPRRTLEGWESGRFPINPTAEVIARVMKAYPKARAGLAASASSHGAADRRKRVCHSEDDESSYHESIE